MTGLQYVLPALVWFSPLNSEKNAGGQKWKMERAKLMNRYNSVKKN